MLAVESTLLIRSLRRSWEDLFIVSSQKLIHLQSKSFFELAKVLSRLQILFRKGLLVSSHAKASCKADGIIYVEFFSLLGCFLVLEEEPHKFIVLSKEYVLLVGLVMLVGIHVLDDPGSGGSILFRISFRRHHPLELWLLIVYSKWPSYRGRSSLGLDAGSQIRAAFLI